MFSLLLFSFPPTSSLALSLSPSNLLHRVWARAKLIPPRTLPPRIFLRISLLPQSYLTHTPLTEIVTSNSHIFIHECILLFHVTLIVSIYHKVQTEKSKSITASNSFQLGLRTLLLQLLYTQTLGSIILPSYTHKRKRLIGFRCISSLSTERPKTCLRIDFPISMAVRTLSNKYQVAFNYTIWNHVKFLFANLPSLLHIIFRLA